MYAKMQRGIGRGNLGMPDRVTPHFQMGWRLFKAEAGVFISSMILLFLSGIVFKLPLLVLHRSGSAISLMLLLTWLLVFSGMIVGLHVMALKSVDGRIPKVGDLFDSFALGPAYLLALALYCVAVSLGFVLFILPGIYLAIRYCLFAQIITDKSAGALAALRDAAVLARGSWSQLGALFLMALLLNVAGAAILGVGLVISFPVSLLAIAGFYRSLQPATA
jgi:hypothetical protein